MPAPPRRSPRNLPWLQAEPDRATIWAALGAVRDPELDEAITALGFVAGLEVDGSRVSIRLRLPTYFCAPNFAYLMAADARAAVRGIDGVTDVDVRLDDHFASDDINAGVADDRGFQAAFAGLAEGDLDDLRAIFRRKALIARQYRLARSLLEEGARREKLASLRIRHLPRTNEVTEYLDRRAELGLDVGPDAPFLVDAQGSLVDEDTLDLHLGMARATRVSMEANAGFCRGLLVTRYGAETGVPASDARQATTPNQPKEPE